MKIYELVEARRNPHINNQRGRKALFDYLNSLPEDILNRTYVHLSMINKVGVNPTDRSASIGDPFEPVGVFTYRANDYIKSRGVMEYAASYPIIHVITIRQDQHHVLTNVKFKKFQRKLEKLYPDYEFGDNVRSNVTRRLIYKGYSVVNTNTVGGESVIVDPQAIENVTTFEVEYIHPDDIAGADVMSNGTLEWQGSKYVRGIERNEQRIKYDRMIRDKKILNHASEYELARIDPDLYQNYLNQVLIPQEIKPKLSPQEQRAAQRKHYAAKNRLPHKAPADWMEWEDEHEDDDSSIRYPITNQFDPQYFQPSRQSAPKLYNYARLTKRPLDRNQEIAIISNGKFLHTDYALEYYELLASWGLKPQLSYKEMYDVISNRNMINTTEGDPQAHRTVRQIEAIFS